MPQPEAKPNPLMAGRPKRQPQKEHPMMAHARMWQYAHSLPPDQLATETDRTDYALPIIGALAGNPKVTAKDVIKAAAQAAADGKIPPSGAVQVISQIPPDPDKLQPWLRQMYAAHLSAAVHMKAAMMSRGMAPNPANAPPSSDVPIPAAPKPDEAEPLTEDQA